MYSVLLLALYEGSLKGDVNSHLPRSLWNEQNVHKIRIFFYSYISTFTIDINKIKKTKSKIHITVIRCKATITPEIKLKEEQLQN